MIVRRKGNGTSGDNECLREKENPIFQNEDFPSPCQENFFRFSYMINKDTYVHILQTASPPKSDAQIAGSLLTKWLKKRKKIKIKSTPPYMQISKYFQ